MTEAGSARRHRRGGDGAAGRGGGGGDGGLSTVLSVFPGLRHPGLGLAPAVTEAGFQA